MSYNRIIKRSKYSIAFLKTLVFFISLPSRFYRNSKRNKDLVAVIALHKLGDAVFTIPAIKQIRKNYNSNIIILCFPETKCIYQEQIKGISIIEIRHDEIHFNNRISGGAAIQKLRKINPQIIYDLTGTITSASLLMFNKAARVIGLNEEYFSPLYTSFKRIRKEPHLIDNYLNALDIKIIDKGIKEFKSHYSKTGYIYFQPFAGWPAKEWGLNRFLKLAKNVGINYKYRIILPPNNFSKEFLHDLDADSISYKITYSIEELITSLKECSLFVANDSGPLHIAALLGKPTFTIYGPTNPAYHHPFGANHRYVQKILKCSPQVNEKLCFTNGGIYGCPSFECMVNLPYKEVEEKILTFISDLKIEKK